MPSKLKGFFQGRKSRSPQTTPTPSLPVTELSQTDMPQAPAPQNPLAEPSRTGAHARLNAANIQSPPKPIGEGQNYGVKELYDGGTEASIDIVFVHGLTGNAYNTWLHKDTDVYWPSELLTQDIPDARILSFGYDADVVKFWDPASNSRLSNHAENMVGGLVRKRERTNTETRRIIYVAHSLGGLVVEHALNHSRSAAIPVLRQIEQYTAGIIFLGVPHCGADLAAWASVGTRIVNLLRRANKDIVGVLEPGSEMLRVVEKGFSSILSLRKDEGSEIFVTCFYEELPVIGVGEIVPLHSAEIKPYGCYGIHANHMDMTKFPNREDQGYDAVLGEIQRWKKSIYGKEAPTNAKSRSDINQDPEFAHPWIVPRATSRLYTGRGKLGERLAQVLAPDPSPPLSQRVFVLTGLGGTGKSEVCLKFAEDHRDKYWGVFWLDATSNNTADEGYIDIGRRCGILDPSVGSVKSWLADRSRRWLLIIDNADNPEIDYSQHIPRSNTGDILFTTRNPECAVHNTVGSERLEVLEPELAKDLLLHASGIDQSQWTEKTGAALAIVDILGSHTLAIIQAGAFIRRKQCTIEQYPVIFQQEKGQLLNFHSKQNLSVYRNVYTTFEVSAKYLERSDLPEALDALNLLHHLAFMHNSGISETIFRRATEHALQLKEVDIQTEEVYSLSKNHITRLPEYIKGQTTLQNQLRWRKACSVLESLSIITIHTDDNDSFGISAHSLIHAWAKERQDHNSRRKTWQSAATTIAFSCRGWLEYCPYFILLQPHVRACIGHDIKDYTQQISEMQTAQILFQLAYVLYRMRDDDSLNLLVQHIRSRLQNKAAANKEIASEIAIFVGRVYENQGEHGKAVHIYQDIVESQFETLAEDDSSRLTWQHALAGAYQANGQVEEAVKLLEHVVKVHQKLAEDHPDRLASQHTLASAYKANGQIEEALKLLKHVVKVKEKLAEDHPSRLASQHELARAYQANGQIEEAVKLLEHVVKVNKKLAEDHPSRLTSQHELAGAYRANGQIEEAVKLLEHVVKVQEKLAEDHPSRLTSQCALAGAYYSNRQMEEAVELLEHVVKVRKKLAEDHPDRLDSEHALAVVSAFKAARNG